MKRMHFGGLAVVSLVLAAPLAARAAQPNTPADLALSASRDGRGLCVYIGAGGGASPDLIARLASDSKMLVHGLALDDSSMERARKAIDARGVAGQASVEKASMNPLPYMSNLANVVVIDDWVSTSAKGLTRAEALRVLAPGGTLLVHENGQWGTTVKPRPAEMDDWRFPMHDVGLTRTSSDKTFSFPIGLRWTDGVPNNLRGFTDCCGVIVVDNTIFTLSSAEIENVPRARSEGGCPIYLGARDAFNGLPLWKLDLENTRTGVEISASDVPPLAGDGNSVYTAYRQNRIIRVDARGGRILWEQPTKHRTARLTLLDGVIVAGSWGTRNTVWGYEYPDAGTGVTEAFDARTGKPLWQKDHTAEQMIAGDGLVYVELACAATTQPGAWSAWPVIKGTPTVIAVDIRTGEERWRVEQKEGTAPKLQLVSAGPKYVVLTHCLDEKSHYSRILDAATGRTIVDGQEKKLSSGRAPMIDGLVWFAGHKFDLTSGQDKGNTGVYLGLGCTPLGLVWPYVIGGRGGEHTDYSKVAGGGRPVELHYNGARAACLEGMVIANGMLYTAQNNCQCLPPHLYGFLGLAPCGSEPTAEEFAKSRPVEKGPAFGTALSAEGPQDGTAWPMLRADAARSASSKSKLPARLAEAWSLQVTPAAKGPLWDSWDSRLTGCLSAPVVAEGKVFVSATDVGQVIACDAAGGKRLWTANLGSRVDGPPTWYRGLCIIGCHDGTVCALRASDGQLVWQAQVAPWARKIVDHARVESVWPAAASVVVQDGVAYASAGRNTETDGGVVVAALDAATGKTIWARQLAGALRMNDILSMKDGQLAWRFIRMDRATGKTLRPAAMPTLKDSGGGGGKLEGGIMDGTYTMAANRRAGRIFNLGNSTYDLLAWNDHVAAGAGATTPKGASPQIFSHAIVSSDGGTLVAQAKLQGRGRVMALAIAENLAVYSYRNSEMASATATNTLNLVSLEDGKTVQQLPLPVSTTYDGLAVAGGKLFVSRSDGRLVCLAAAEQAAP